MYRLLELPEGERPRERLLAQGAETLATAELIAILLGSGMRGKSVLHLAQEILSRFGSLEDLARASVEELTVIPGMGQAKAVTLQAAFCLGKRLQSSNRPDRYTVSSPAHAYHLVRELIEDANQEHLLVLLLDSKGGVIRIETVFIGSLNESVAHPREIFHRAVRYGAASLLVVHNHPSGNPEPSRQDLQFTERLIQAGKVMGIPLQDHLVIGHGRYCSIREGKTLAF